MLLLHQPINVVTQDQSIQRLTMVLATGNSIHLQMTTNGSPWVETTVTLTLIAHPELVVSVSTLDTPIFCKRLAVIFLDTGLLIKFVELHQAMVLHSIAKKEHQKVLLCGISMPVLVLVAAIKMEQPQTAVDVQTGKKKVFQSQLTQTPKSARIKTLHGNQESRIPFSG